ncbi:hypothetical protein LTR37_003328 [Vermiconidia calcicola]|uniref:Uncharacterized protein n=1 Tax=Vermiconidia calcicola TaxID=1690605 RepID=A0ACC3NRC7_9PEZI|nr:hypothetical protein LTR37_003328 [Vermiconidia calcicola]
MDYFDLGHYRRPISTTSEAAQTWFDRGLIWSYGFNHEEATQCFERAINEDSHCLMALWGIAYSVGPNYNKPWEVFDPTEMERNLAQTQDAIKTAKDRATSSNSTELERRLIHALRWRYQEDSSDRLKWNLDYAQAMEKVYHQFGEDLDVAALYADSLMNLTPWSLWDPRTGQPTEGSRTLEAKSVLERAMAQEGDNQHPGLLHLYIHLMEMSSTPEAALPAADRLRGLVADAGHLHHMPTHLDVLCGDYRRVVSSNSDAIKADECWLAQRGALNFYSLYRCHNYHFRIYGAMFAGQSKIALETAAQLEKSISDELLRVTSPPMADWLEGFFSMRLHVLVRFGRWSDILSLELPQDEELYCVTVAMVLYAQGIAFANTGRTEEAVIARTYFREAVEKVPTSRTLFNNTCKDILAIGGGMLDGELEYHRGDMKTAFERLRKAVELSDTLPYDEPWGWMQPPRHAYGALLLEQGRVEDAEAVYSADLGLSDALPRALQHPNNLWALHGYHECLMRQDRGSEARFVKKQLDLVSATADVAINSSCYCRTKGLERSLFGGDIGIPPWRFNRPNE